MSATTARIDRLTSAAQAWEILAARLDPDTDDRERGAAVRAAIAEHPDPARLTLALADVAAAALHGTLNAAADIEWDGEVPRTTPGSRRLADEARAMADDCRTELIEAAHGQRVSGDEPSA